MSLPESWQKIPVPLGLTVGATIVAYGGLAFLHNGFVQAQEYQQFKQTLGTRSLKRDKKALELEVMKQKVYPQKFDAIDAAILKQQKEDLVEVKEISLRSRHVT